MHRITILLIILFSHVDSSGQCKSTWLVNNRDTASYNEYYFPNEKTTNIRFADLIKQIRIPRLNDYMRNRLTMDLDSLKNLKPISSGEKERISNEIRYTEHELRSVFQTIELDLIEFALYKIDSVLLTSKSKEPIYVFSTSFFKNWNEDYDSWRLFYNPKFGLLRYEFHSFDVDYLGINKYQFHLINNCKVSEANLVEFKTLIEIVKTMGIYEE